MEANKIKGKQMKEVEGDGSRRLDCIGPCRALFS